jgi:hypothetical protein
LPWVEFKCDIEQSGRIVEIRSGYRYRGPQLVLKNESGFCGEYIGGQTRTTEDARDCF